MSDGTTTLCWAYDSSHQRVRMDQVSTCGGSPVSSTYYLNDSISGAMAELIVSGSSTTWKDYLIVSGVMIGTRTVVNGGTPATTYYVLDKMGSVAATTDQTGALLCRIAYDAWGQRQSVSGSACVQPTREFTGEETINTGALYNLVNLNARIYDPVLGRFMSADTISGSPLNGQRLNAYTYALNSPLVFTDRSGMCSGTVIDDPELGGGSTDSSFSCDSGPGITIGDGGSPSSSTFEGTPAPQPWQPFLGSTQPVSGMSTVGSIARTSTNAAPLPSWLLKDLPAFLQRALNGNAAANSTAAFAYAIPDQIMVTGCAACGADATPEQVLVTGPAQKLQGFPSDILVAIAGGRASFEVGGAALEAIYSVGQSLLRLFERPPAVGGGRLGSAATRQQNSEIADQLESGGYIITRGGGRAQEEYIPGPGGGTKGSTYVDITAMDPTTGEVLRVQTVDSYANGMPTQREIDAAQRIQNAFPDDQLWLIPKR